MKVYFSHGKERDPRGSKIKRLAKTTDSMGCTVETFDYTDTMGLVPAGVFSGGGQVILTREKRENKTL